MTKLWQKLPYDVRRFVSNAKFNTWYWIVSAVTWRRPMLYEPMYKRAEKAQLKIDRMMRGIKVLKANGFFDSPQADKNLVALAYELGESQQVVDRYGHR